jgi:CheY-like chemotaxis protein
MKAKHAFTLLLYFFICAPTQAQELLSLPSTPEGTTRGDVFDPSEGDHLTLPAMTSVSGYLQETYGWANNDTLIGQLLVNSDETSYILNHTGVSALFKRESDGSLTCVTHQILGPEAILASEVTVGEYTRRTIAQTAVGPLFIYLRTASIQAISFTPSAAGRLILSAGTIEYGGAQLVGSFGMNIIRQAALRVAVAAPPVAVFVGGAAYVWWRTSQQLQGWANNYARYQNFWTKVWYVQRWNLFRAYLGSAAATLLAERLRDMADDELWEDVTSHMYDDIEKIRESEWHQPDPDPNKEFAKWIWRIATGMVVLDQALEWAKENLSPDNADRVEELVRRAKEAEGNKLVLICEDSEHDVTFMRRLHRLPFFTQGGYEVVVAETTTEAETIITSRAEELRLVILDGKMPPEMEPFSTARLLPFIPMTALLIGNTDSPDVQDQMGATGRFVYIARNKTDDLAGVPWRDFLPLLP